jgi:TIR domain
VWYDDKIVSGDRWERLIRDKIDTCTAMIVVMTPDADNSDWVAMEIARAHSRARPILPLLRAGEPFFSLSTVHYEDVRDGSMPGEPFVGRLRGFVPPDADTPPPPSPPPPKQPVDHPTCIGWSALGPAPGGAADSVGGADRRGRRGGGHRRGQPAVACRILDGLGRAAPDHGPAGTLLTALLQRRPECAGLVGAKRRHDPLGG